MSGSVLADVATALGAARAADLGGIDSAALISELAEVESLARQLDAFRFAVLGEVERRRRHGEYGLTSTAELLVASARVDVRDARHLAESADVLAARTSLAGEALAPLLPRVARAVSEARVGAGHVQVLRATTDRLPSWMDTEQAGTAEQYLVDRAGVETVGQLRRTAAVFLARLQPDDPPPPDAERRDRQLTLTCLADGTGRLTGSLSVQATAAMTAVLDALAAPQPANDGTPDPRTAGQRRHDALVESCRRLLTAHRSGRALDPLPAAGGLPVTIVVRTTADELEQAARAVAAGAAASTDNAGAASTRAPWQARPVALTDRSTVWPLTDLLAAAPRARVVALVVDPAGAVIASRRLRLGRTARLASPLQRLALAGRDGGCCFPGCAAPVRWCQAHHVVEWSRGGLTDIGSLALLCGRHHRAVGRNGWELRMRDGVPEWVPPPWVDPRQRPRPRVGQHLDLAVEAGPAARPPPDSTALG